MKSMKSFLLTAIAVFALPACSGADFQTQAPSETDPVVDADQESAVDSGSPDAPAEAGDDGVLVEAGDDGVLADSGPDAAEASGGDAIVDCGAIVDDGATDTFMEADTTSSDSDAADTPTDGVGPPACPVPIKEGKVAEFNDPTSTMKATAGDGIHVHTVATSGKFVVSKTWSTLKCLYGVFVADPNATFAAYSGILVTSQSNGVVGDSGVGSVTCSDDDLIPNDVKAGDLLDITGTYDLIGPSTAVCASMTPPLPLPTPAKAPQLTRVCKLTRTPGGTVPVPLDVSTTDLINGSTTVLRYSSGLVRVKNVTAATATAPGDSSFGVFNVSPGGLPITDKVYYRGAGTAPVVKVGDKFTLIVGESYLDFCTWSLAPTSRCDMVLSSDAGVDSGTCP